MINSLSKILLAFCLLTACSQPLSREYFVATEERNTDGNYVFHLELSDTLLYTISLVMPLDCVSDEYKALDSIGLGVKWISPSGMQAAEKVYFDRSSIGRSVRNGNQLFSVYRDNIGIDMQGVWSLYFKLTDESIEKYKVAGIGLILDNNGTRKIKEI